MPDFPSSSQSRNGSRVAVVAAGVVSPLGFGLDETFRSLQTARDCVTSVTRFSVEQCRCKTAGQIADDRLISESRNGNTPRHRLHRAAQMLICALGEALSQDRQFRPEL